MPSFVEEESNNENWLFEEYRRHYFILYEGGYLEVIKSSPGIVQSVIKTTRFECKNN